MAHIIQVIGLFLVLCFITAILIARRITIQRSLNIAANTKAVKCSCPNYLNDRNFMFVKNPFVGHFCKYYENRVFQSHCKNDFYSPVPSNTLCVHFFRTDQFGSVNVRTYHTWSDKHGNFYVYDPNVDVYAKWDEKGQKTSDWGMNPSYMQGIKNVNGNFTENNFECFLKFDRKWCHLKNIPITKILCDFFWNPFLGKKCIKK